MTDSASIFWSKKVFHIGNVTPDWRTDVTTFSKKHSAKHLVSPSLAVHYAILKVIILPKCGQTESPGF
jgi:hypothetical protein